MIQLSIFLLIFAAKWEKSTSAEGALCTNLANGNLRNFHSNVQEGTMLHAICVGLWIQFHIKVISGPPFGTGKDSPALLPCAAVKLRENKNYSN